MTLAVEPMGIVEQYRFAHFIEEDTTNLNNYDADEYSCLDYVMSLWKNATAEGYDIALVNIASCKLFPDGHYCVAYEKDTGGWVLIEPQTDLSWNDVLSTNDQEERIVIFKMIGTVRINQTTLMIPDSAILAIARI